MMRLDESSLETAEPYHIPGYCGYCPQLKYKIKETFGKTTHKLLTADGITRSTRPVLAPLDSSRFERKKDQSQKLKLLEARAKNVGDKKYGFQMVPGYTGYIPKAQHYFGDRYALSSSNALAHLEQDQDTYNEQQKQLQNMIRLNTPSLKPISKRVRMYFPKGPQHSISPYTLANDDPRKYMMSGYTGFVPESRGIIGAGYPNVSNKALCTFTTHHAKNKALIKAPIILDRPNQISCDTKPIYYEDSGMVPNYTGHVPGEKFRYGQTFGHSTANAY